MSQTIAPADLSAKKRALLELLLRERQQEKAERRAPIAPRPDPASAPLTFAQGQLWFLDRFQPGSSAYNVPAAFRLHGRLDVKALEAALSAVVQRHEALRTVFAEVEGEPLQRILAPEPVRLAALDLTSLSAEARDAELTRLIDEEARRPFDLTGGPLLRARLIALGPDDHVLQFTLHHIVCDGWSVGVLLRELSALYEASSTGRGPNLSDLPIQYGDYAGWQRRRAADPDVTKAVDHFVETLRDAPEVLRLPLDRPRPAVQSFRGGRQSDHVDRELTARLRALSAEAGTTLYMTTLAAFAVLLHRYSSQTDIVVGSPTAGRGRTELEGLIGFFANTLPLRVDLGGDVTFGQLLARVKQVTLDLHDHQSAPFEKIVEALKLPRDMSRSPVFQVAFALYGDDGGLSLAGLQASPIGIDPGSAKFDLVLEVIEEADGLRCSLEYCRDLFDEATSARLLGHYLALLDAVAADPQRKVAELPLLTERERRQMLVDWNSTALDLPAEACVQQLFEKHAARHPQAEAVGFGTDTVSYAELNRRANQLAHHLRARGVGPGVPVALCFERSIEMVVGLLGVLKSGGAYVPLDPAWPADRLAFVLDDVKAPVLLTTASAMRRTENASTPTLCLDTEWSTVARERTDNPELVTSGDDLAYIIYTSGSTGRPKGVLIPHAGLSNLVAWHNTAFAIEPADRASQIAAVAFDACTWEIWPYLAAGASVHLVEPRRIGSGALWAWLAEQRITRAFMPTPLAEVLLREALPATLRLRTLLVGGDRLTQGPPVDTPFTVVNNYGPTESSVVATSGVVPPGSPDAPLPDIGRPIANTRIYILDAAGLAVPIGVAGEIYIAGRGLARGYLNREALTAEKFVADPFDSRPGARLYRTGDLARYRADGAIDFIGRSDDQVKIRGFRVEPGEIEARLRSHPAVADAVVVVREDRPGDKRLAAYVTARPGGELNPDGLRRHAQVTLPDYMVPAAFVIMASLPLTGHGKVDRAALPAPVTDGRTAAAPGLAPGTELEAKIAEVWRAELQVSHVGPDDNFFDLGGHSLSILRVQNRLKEAIGRDVSVVDLFQYPTVSALSRFLAPAVDEPVAVASTDAPAAGAGEPALTREPVAIIGMAGRFPGARNIDELWRNLRDGREAIRRLSDEELLKAGVEADALADPGYVKAGAVLDGVDEFDAAYFGFSPREAETTDPQHRLFLECAHEALESAGYDPHTYAGAVGVYAGSAMSTYLTTNLYGNAVVLGSLPPAQAMIGNDKDFLPTRVSYKLNLRGPSINVQTACSTSLVAVHMACQDLATGACDVAVAGGVSLRFPHPTGYPFLEGSIMSPDGHCRPFDARAAGTIASSGVGIVVLKRLSRALADGDRILAVVKGSAINNDGANKVGYTAPSVEGQARVIRAAQLAAGTEPDTISYVEAHGTGTHLGDPIEIAALTKAFRTRTERRGYCAVGSIKSNLGHLDIAAGVTGLIKTVLQLQHRLIVPSLHYETPNPEINFDASPFYVNTTLRDWNGEGEPRRAGVSSFGIGGTNAHVVLEEAPVLDRGGASREWQLLTLSARTENALEAASHRLREYLEGPSTEDLADITFTLHTGRTSHACRRTIVCRTHDEALAALASGAAGRTQGAPASADHRVVFLFPGQGAQYVNMARGLYEREAVFRGEIDRCAGLLDGHLGGHDLRVLMFSDAADAAAVLRQTWVTQPALFVIEYALARLWLSWGIVPSAMIGHSIGEYVAACIAGVMGLDDALRLVALRGRLMDAQPKGSMLAVSMSADEALAFAGADVSVAAVNGPRFCVLSGPDAAIARIEQTLADQGESGRRLHTSHAFHSAMMDPVLDEFAAAAARVPLRAPTIPCVSNVSGTWMTPVDATDPGYWARHLRGTVRFAEGVDTLLTLDAPLFLEVGPGNTLGSFVRKQAAVRSRRVTVAASLPGHDEAAGDTRQIVDAIGQLWRAGVSVDWAAFHHAERRVRVSLPTYPFERERFFIEPDKTSPERHARHADRADWFYAPSWERGRALTAGQLRGDWIVCGDSVLAAHLANALRGAGRRAIEVTSDTAFHCLSADRYRVNPASRDDLGRLFATVRESGPEHVNVVHAWDVAPGRETLEETYLRLLRLVQAISGELDQRPVSLTILTGDAYEVTGGETPRPERAALVAASRVIAREYPNITCRVIDVAGGATGTDASETTGRVVRELGASEAIDLVALRGPHRWLPVFQPVRLAAPSTPGRIKHRGVYLITGGLGGIALAIARELTRSVNARLVLVSRSALPPREQWPSRLAATSSDRVAGTIREIQALEAAGGAVLTIAADVADAAAMRAVIAAADARFGGIDGVIHAAGVAGGALIERQDLATSAAVFAPKVTGTNVLCELFSKRALDFFVLFSSQRSILPAPGRIDYCAANAYLDAVAAGHSGKAAWPITSIIWENWRERGMGAIDQRAAAANPLLQKAWESSLANDEGVDAFVRAVESALPVVVVSTRDLADVIRENNALTTELLAETSTMPAKPAQPLHARPELDTAYVPPQSEAERLLVQIWEQLLGVERIGVTDNFFELGGDSVVSIQVIARAAKAGLKLSAKQVFQHQTIATLAAAATETAPVVRTEATPAAGAAPLTPIQAWFFEQETPHRDHFNQAVMLRERTAVPAALFERALQAIVSHHDALRVVFRQVDGRWSAVYRPYVERPLVTSVDLRDVADAALAQQIEAHADRLQRGLDIGSGDFVRVVRFDCGDRRPARLLIAIHHLVVDLVSWRLLLEDLETACRQLMAGEPVALPATTASFKEWAERLSAHVRQDGFTDELAFWTSAERRDIPALPTDFPAAAATMGSVTNVRTEFDPELTRALLRDLPRAHNTQIGDAFLAALARTFHEWTGERRLLVDIEGLGREPIFDEVDTSRTVGWFTSVYPVLAEWTPGCDAATALAAARDCRRAVPSHGLSYGALRYLRSASPEWSVLSRAEVCFLYLGQSGHAATDATLFEPAAESTGRLAAEGMPLPHRLTLNAEIVDGRLRCEWVYSPEVYRPETIERIAALFERALRDLVNPPSLTAPTAVEEPGIDERTFALTPMQQGMLFHTLSAPEAAEYFRHIAMTLEGPLDTPKFQAAWRVVVGRHAALRTSFRWEGTAEPVQVIASAHADVPWTIESLANLDRQSQDRRLAEFIGADSRQPFDLTRPPLMRCALFQRQADVHELVWSFHHIILDGWSFALVLQDVLKCYEALRDGRASAADRPPQFTEYLELVAGQSLDEAERFWRSSLQGFAVPTSVALDGLGDRTDAVEPYAELRVRFRPETAARVRSMARECRLTVNAVVQGVWSVLLSRYSGSPDVLFGAVVSGRPPDLPGVEQMVGLFINSLPVRAVVPADEPVVDFLQRLQLAQAEARDYEHTPLWKIQEWSEVPRPQPLFDSLIVYENYPLSDDLLGRIAGLRIRFGSSYERTNYPLTVTVPGASAESMLFTYSTQRFSDASISRMGGHVETLLDAISRNPRALVRDLPVLPPAERHQVIDVWNQTQVDLPTTACVHDLIAAQAQAGPDRAAVTFENQVLTYAELDERAARLAGHLRELGARRGTLIGVCLTRSADMLVAVLGVLKSGAAYVPLDPSYPRERLEYMLDDSGAPILVTEQRQVALLPGFRGRVVRMDADRSVIETTSPAEIAEPANGNDAAYVIYTSGSTGKPKGVLIEHGALANFLHSMQREPGLTRDDVLLAVTTLSFDIAGLELYLPLICGARVAIAGADVAMDAERLAAAMAATGATVMQATPATWRMLIESGWRGDSRLKVLCGGEAMPRNLADQLLDRAGEVWNMYGPTETTIWSTVCRVERGRRPVLIGRPIANTTLYILDRHGAPVPIGAAGHLHIGGAGLARGYLNRDALTSERFTDNPVAERAGERIYHTGDLARYHADGQVECLGRVDHQVKIRGHRIELGEIEAALEQCAAVGQAVVVVREDRPGDPRLTAYVVARPNETPGAAAMREALRNALPDYMVPAAYIVLDAFPLTPNGKVDRRALPAPDPGDGARDQMTRPPATATERLIVEIWQEVLAVDRVSVDDDFFDLGGHSLLLTRVQNRLRQALSTSISITELFRHATVAGLAAYLDSLREAPAQASLAIAPAAVDPRQALLIEAIAHEGEPSAPLTSGQQRLWFLHELEPESYAYNICSGLRLRGALDVSALQRSLDALVSRHESVRTRLVTVAGEPRQIVDAARAVPMAVLDLAAETETAAEAALADAARNEARRPFDLGSGLLLRATLIRLAPESHALLISVHHIVSDGWSLDLMQKELTALYAAFVEGRPDPLPPLPMQYRTYARWQEQWLQRDEVKTQLAYWTGQLTGAPAALDLPADRPRPRVQSTLGAYIPFTIPAPVAAALRTLSQQENATLFMTTLAAFQLLLARHSGQDDIVVGTPIAGRTLAETEGLIGLFVNTLAMRSTIAAAATGRALVREAKATALAAYAHQDVPFERLVEALNPPRDLSRPPVFQVMFVFQAPSAPPAFAGLEVAPLPVDVGTSKFDLSLMLSDTGTEVIGAFEYAAALFDASTIDRLVAHFQTLLADLAARPDIEAASLALLPDAERQQLGVTWNATAREYSSTRGVHELFEAQASRTPDAVAAIFEGQSLTYAELNVRANQLAWALRGRGIAPGQRVALCLNRSLEMLVGVLAVLKTGAAYVPLDPAYPIDRVRFMIDDAEASVLLTEQALTAQLPEGAAPVLCVDRDRAEIAGQRGDNLPSTAAGDDLAYVIYTSGSTGKPKGVMVTHGGVVNFLESMRREPGLKATDRLLAVTTLSFDIAGLELLLPLVAGAVVEVASRELAIDGRRLRARLEESGTTVMQATPATWRMLIEAGWAGSSDFRVLCGGEALPRELALELRARAGEVWNLYGPTETTIWSTVERVTDVTDAVVRIGRPVANTEIYILNAARQLAPIGVAGELHIGGAGLARGYWQRPELTAEKFIANPFGAPQSRLYRTGDAARWRADGTLEFIGRLDHQVKLRGHRIELGEIEASLERCAGVSQAVVLVREDRPGDPRLVAYVVPESKVVPEIGALREHVRQQLPDYMVPSTFVTLSELPLTPNGKVDRRALAPPPSDVPRDSGRAPRDQFEIQLTRMFERVLGVASVGLADNFFDLGGHSLLAVRLFTEIEAVFERNLPLATLFEAPTVERLADVLRQQGWSAPWASLVPLQPHGAAPPFFCIHSLGSNLVSYRKLAHLMGEDQPFFGLQPQGLDGAQAPHERVEDMAAHYIREIRKIQPHGPYRLGGVCLGGIVALEMAQQLRDQGEEVSLLAMIDSYFPGTPQHLAARAVSPRLSWVADYYLGDLLLRSPRERAIYILTRIRNIVLRGGRLLKRALGRVYPQVLEEGTLPRVLKRIQAANAVAERRYVPCAYDGRIHLFWCSEFSARAYQDKRLAWSDIAADGLETHVIPGNHMSMVEDPHVTVLAAKLRKCLDKDSPKRAAKAGAA